MSALPLNLVDTAGFLVADNRGRVVGKVECPMYGTVPDVPDALSVRGGFFSRHRRLVPADTIADGRQLDLVGRRAHETGLHSPSFSENGQVLLELPLGELDSVLVPLGPLQLDVPVEDVRAERLANELRPGESVDGLPERLRQGDDSALLSLFGREVVEVRLHWIR